MAEERGEEHGGLLIRGADGSLWFMRDDAVAPVRLEDDVATNLDRISGARNSSGVQWAESRSHRDLAEAVPRAAHVGCHHLARHTSSSIEAEQPRAPDP